MMSKSKRTYLDSAWPVGGMRKPCQNVKVLSTPVQRNLCRRNVKLVEIMARAARQAIDECQHQFKYDRWNCSTYNHSDVFGRIVNTSKKRERERKIIFILYYI
jgi:hypothetical protein